MKLLGGCWQIAELMPELNTGCCSSCHNDDDDGYGSLCTVDGKNGYWEVCCSMSQRLTEAIVEKLDEKVTANQRQR